MPHLSHVSRRTLLQHLATATVTAVAVGGTMSRLHPPGSAVLAAAPPARQGRGIVDLAVPVPGGNPRSATVSMWAQAYTPASGIASTAATVRPRDAMDRVAQEYHGQHPGTLIEMVKKPESIPDRLWLEAGQAGGTIPHIVQSPAQEIDGDINRQVRGWWVPLDAALNEPNPYVTAGEAGSQHWIDQFYPHPTSTRRAVDGHIYVVPYDLTTSLFYYNRALFKKADIELEPKTWADLMAACSRLKEVGVVPLAQPGPSDVQVGAMILEDVTQQVHPGTGPVSQADVACAIKKKVYDPLSSPYADWMRVLQSMAAFYPSDWSQPAVGAARRFSTGQVAILEDWTPRWGSLKADPTVEFEWGTFYCPTVTKETSQYAIGITAPPLGGPTTQWAVTSTADKAGVVDLAVDFLRFLCVPQFASMMIGELGDYLPNIRQIDVPSLLAAPFRAISEGYGESSVFLSPSLVSQEASKKVEDAWVRLRLGQATLQDTQDTVSKILNDASASDIKVNDWHCG